MRALVVIAALLAFGAVAFYAVQTYPALIETDLQRRASAALNAANLQFAKVDVKGRVVTLSGEAPGPNAKEDAVKIASNVWGVESVTDALTVDTAALPVSPQTVTAPPATAAEPAATPPPPTEPAPAPAEPSSSPLPSVAGAIDPSLAPSTDSAPEAPPVPAEATTPLEQPPAAPATPPQETQTALAEQPPAPAPAPAPAGERAAPAPPTAEPVPSSVAPAAPAPAPVLPPPAPAPSLQATLTQGATTGLSTSVQTAAAPVAEPPSYRLEARVEGRRVELQGLVSTPSAELALVAHVRRHIRRAHVVDSLKVAHTKPDRDWLDVARKSLSQLSRLDTGSLKLDGHAIAVSGKPKSDNDRTRLLAALNDLPKGYTSTVLLERKAEPAPAPAPAIVASVPEPPPASSRPVAAAPRTPRIIPRHATPRYRSLPRAVPVSRSLSTECRYRFGDVLPHVAVVFESGSSRLRQNAVAGLDELARIARACPGARIRLTGHSDTQEVPATYLALSRQRALAVREALEERGVVGSNISVASRGGLRPAFSNATADGRENNRRVEFAVW